MRAEMRAVADGRSPDASAAVIPAARPLGMTAEASALTHAATVQFAVPAVAPAASLMEAPKPTLVGTASTVPGPNKTRNLVVVGAIVGVLGFGATVLLLARHRPVAAVAGPSATAAMVAPSTSMAPLTDMAPLAPLDPLRAAATGPATAGVRASGPGKAVAAVGAGAKGGGSGSAAAIAAAAAPPTPVPAPTAAPPPVAVAAAPPPAAEAADPSFDPEGGYVEVGLINGQGVRDGAVRGALHGAGLSACYKNALRAKGARATGVATLNLSFDEKGAARSVILTDAAFLPGLTRCVQGATGGLHVAASQVDPGGGTAEVFLAFKVR
jgi:hypothetical protein